MQKRTLFCNGLWPFLTLPLIPLLIFTLSQWRDIEHQIANRVQTAIDGNSNKWATAETYNRGRDILITGVAPSSSDIESVKQMALQIKGVRKVMFSSSTLAEGQKPTIESIIPAVKPTPASLSINWDAVKITVSGSLNPKQIRRIKRKLSETYPDLDINDQIVSNIAANDLADMEDLMEVFKDFDEDNRVEYSNGNLSLSGVVGSEKIIQEINQHVAQIKDIQVDNRLTVSLSEDLRAERCEQIINDLLGDAKINFASGNVEITRHSEPLLVRIAGIAGQCPDTQFQVVGHTDVSGDPQKNKQLSLLRARSVINNLTDRGIARSRFVAIGMGSDQPVADNSTSEGRHANRRIEFNIVN